MAIFLIDLVPLFVALGAMLIMLAGWVFYQPLRSMVNDLPFPLDAIAGAITGGIKGAISALVRPFDALVVPLAHAIMMAAGGIWRFAYQIVTSMLDAKMWATNAYNLAHTAEQDALAALNVIPAEVANGVTQAEQYTDKAIGRVETDIGSTVAASVAAALIPIEGAISDVSSEANRLFGTAETDIANGVATAEAFAQGLADAVQSDAVRLFGQAETDITVLGNDIAALPGIIEGTIPGIVEGVVPGLIAGAIPGILSQVIPRVTTLETEVAQCLEPLCDTVTPQAPRLGHLGSLFAQLEDLAIEAAMIALAAECLTNPAAVVSDVSTVINDVGQPVMAGFRDLIGA